MIQGKTPHSKIQSRGVLQEARYCPPRCRACLAREGLDEGAASVERDLKAIMEEAPDEGSLSKD